jgi:hypothetical protein
MEWPYQITSCLFFEESPVLFILYTRVYHSPAGGMWGYYSGKEVIKRSCLLAFQNFLGRNEAEVHRLMTGREQSLMYLHHHLTKTRFRVSLNNPEQPAGKLSAGITQTRVELPFVSVTASGKNTECHDEV